MMTWLGFGGQSSKFRVSQRYLRWRPLGVSWRRNCLSEAFLISTALSTTTSDSYSIRYFASQSRFVTVFNVCTVSLQSFDITPTKSFLLIIIIIIAGTSESHDVEVLPSSQYFIVVLSEPQWSWVRSVTTRLCCLLAVMIARRCSCWWNNSTLVGISCIYTINCWDFYFLS